MEKTKKYYEELNIFRGLIIVWVVIGHSFVSDNTFFGMLTAYAYTFHMASFFILSGILFAPKVKRISNAKEGINVAFGRFKRLIVPYLFFSAVSYVLKLVFEQYAYNELSEKTEIFHDIVFGVNNPNGGIWFLHNLFIFSLFAVILKLLPSWLSFLISCVVYTVNIFVNLGSDFSSLINYAPFFFLGIFISSYYEKISGLISGVFAVEKKRKKAYLITAFATALSLCIFVIYVKFSLAQINPAFKLIPCLVNILCWYLISFCLSKTQKIKVPFNCIGNYGMDIYMIGYYVQISLRVVLGSMLGLPYLLYSTCMFVFGLILPIPLSKYIVRKVKLFRILVLGDFSQKKKETEIENV